MSKTQRLALVGLAVVVAIAAFVVLRPGDEPTATSDRTTAPSGTSTPTDGATTADDQSPEAEAPRKRRQPQLPVLMAGRVRELEVQQGDTVRFAARSSSDEEIHVHGYDVSKEAPAGKTVRMSFEADITGIFEIEFERAGEPIAELKVEP